MSRWNGDTWQSLGDTGIRSFEDFAIATSRGEVFLAWSSEEEPTRTRVSRWDGQSWHQSDEIFSHREPSYRDGEINSYVSDLLISADGLPIVAWTEKENRWGARFYAYVARLNE